MPGGKGLKGFGSRSVGITIVTDTTSSRTVSNSLLVVYFKARFAYGQHLSLKPLMRDTAFDRCTPHFVSFRFVLSASNPATICFCHTTLPLLFTRTPSVLYLSSSVYLRPPFVRAGSIRASPSLFGPQCTNLPDLLSVSPRAASSLAFSCVQSVAGTRGVVGIVIFQRK